VAPCSHNTDARWRRDFLSGADKGYLMPLLGQGSGQAQAKAFGAAVATEPREEEGDACGHGLVNAV